MLAYLAKEFATPFTLFGPTHLGALLFIVVFNIWMVLDFRRSKMPWVKKQFCYALAFLLIVQEVSLNVWYAATGQWGIGKSLPIHLCGAALILSAIMLVNKSYAIFEVTYFWGFAGATQALLTPDIGEYGFPHYRFFQFFISHGAIITANAYMTFVEGYRPTWKSVGKTIVITGLYTLVVGGFNLLVDGNYMFICGKPPTASLLDVMGPWPWYLIPLTGVAVAMFMLFYSPYAIKDWLARRKKAAPARAGTGGQS